MFDNKKNEVMHATIKSSSLLLVISAFLVLMTGCPLSEKPQQPSQLTSSFVVLADPRGGGDTWVNALREIRDMNATQDSTVAQAEMIIVAGDMDPINSRHKDYQKVFASANARPVLLPVIGNHEFENDGAHFRYARDTLIPSIPSVVRMHPASCDYYVDHENVRIIVVDAYTDLGKSGVIKEEGRKWVEKMIQKAPSRIDHIFIAFHEPAFPRVRHLKNSFNQNPKERNAFWQMLLEHKDRVRAVLVGHTHFYYRMRVLDPAGAAANDPNVFPDEDGGIYQIDVGAAGNGKKSTIVQVQVEGSKVLFRVLQAERGASRPFEEIDRWSIPQHYNVERIRID